MDWKQEMSGPLVPRSLASYTLNLAPSSFLHLHPSSGSCWLAMGRGRCGLQGGQVLPQTHPRTLRTLVHRTSWQKATLLNSRGSGGNEGAKLGYRKGSVDNPSP